MIKKIFSNFAKLTLAAGMLVSSVASANVITLDIKWDGAPFGNQASAGGLLTFDENAYVNNGNALNFNDVIDFTMEVVDSNSGNGTFNLADFGGIAFHSAGLLDFTQELVGQQAGNCTFGIDIFCSDFNVFSNNPLAPNGVFFYELATSGGDILRLTSITQKIAVPEPASMAVFALVIAGVSARRFSTK